MDGASAVMAAGVAAGIVIVLLAVAIIVVKVAADRRRRRHDAALAEARPVVLRVALNPEQDLAPLADLDEGGVREAALSLLPKLRGPDREGLVRVLERLGTIEDARQRTYRRGPTGRARAAELLGTAGTSAALPELARLLKDRDAGVRSSAARALGRLGMPEAAPFLIAAVQRPRPVPASIVGLALARLGARASEHLRAGLASPDPGARAACVELLGLHGAAGATQEIEALLAGDPDVRVRVGAATALGRIGQPRSTTAIAKCLDPDEPVQVRAAAAEAMGSVGADRVPTTLARMVGESHPAALAATTALSHAGPDAREWLAARAADGGPGAAEARESLDRYRRRAERGRVAA